MLNVAVPSIKGGSTEEMGGRVGAGEPVDPMWTLADAITAGEGGRREGDGGLGGESLFGVVYVQDASLLMSWADRQTGWFRQV